MRGERWVEERSSSGGGGGGGGGKRGRARGREDAESWAVAELARTKGICGSSRSLARLLARPSPPLPPRFPPALATHTRVYTDAGTARGVQFRARARTYARRPRCRNRGYSRPRKRASRRSAESLLFHRYFTFALRFPSFLLSCLPSARLPSFMFALFFHPSSSRVDSPGEGGR